MSGLSKSVNECLEHMNKKKGTYKGEDGEEAAFQICQDIYQTQGGLLYHSFKYKTDPTQKGNIKRNGQGRLYVEAVSSYTEIDVLLVTKYRVFPIEVKAYKARQITLYNDRIEGCYKTDKSPVHQNEMHCRHLYPAVFTALPEGDVKYIRPIVVFVDRCKFCDKRSVEQQVLYAATILDSLYDLILRLNTRAEYRINLEAMEARLNEIMIECKKKYKRREV